MPSLVNMKMIDMKRIIAFTAVIMLLCGCGARKDRNVTVPFEDMEWTRVAPEEIEFNPFQAIGKDWMALAMGGQSSMNSMTISWGECGVLWNKPVFTVYVSSDRYSRKLMDSSEYFTVMAFPDTRKNKAGLTYIGSHSQRDEPDKTENAGFHVEYTELGNPVFNEASLVYECRIIYKEELKKNLMPDDVKPRYDEMGLHTMFIGEIVNVYRKQ